MKHHVYVNMYMYVNSTQSVFTSTQSNCLKNDVTVSNESHRQTYSEVDDAAEYDGRTNDAVHVFQ